MKHIFLIALLFNVLKISLAQDTARYITSFDGTKIHYQVFGKGNPVVLIHGFTNTSENWKKTSLYRDLLSSGYQVILPDLRGNGLSDKPHDKEKYLNDAEAKDVKGVMTAMKIKSYVVVGYSRGAIIASRLLVLDTRVSKVVIGGMGADFTDPEWPRRKMFYRVLSGDSVPELDGFMRYVRDRGFDQQVLAAQQYGQPSTSKEAFSKTRKPVLIICGDQDEDNGSAEQLSLLIPGAQYKRTPGDHNNAAKTPEFSAEVLSFLR